MWHDDTFVHLSLGKRGVLLHCCYMTEQKLPSQVACGSEHLKCLTSQHSTVITVVTSKACEEGGGS